MTSGLVLKNSSIQHIRVVILTLMMVLAPLTSSLNDSASAWDSGPENNWSREISHDLTDNMSSVNTTSYDVFQVPSNHTITQASLGLSDYWNEVNYSNTSFGTGTQNQWNGINHDTEADANTGNLRLLKTNVADQIDDFEMVSNVPGNGWMANGQSSDIWTIIQNNSNLISQSNMQLPNSGFQNTSFLGTFGKGDISSNTQTCIRSPIINVPRIISNYSISFQHWTAMDSSDSVWVEFFNENNGWTSLPIPSNGGVNHWAGQTNSWNLVNISLDGLLSQNQSSTYFQFCLLTSDVISPRGGWFIDDLLIYNEGDKKGSWFHGNFTGDYLPNALSSLIFPANFSNIPYVDEIEININWDIQGYLYDYLMLDYSIDNGTTWTSISGTYGIPGLGITYNGNFLYAESNGWVPIYLGLNHNFSASGGLNHTLLKFTVHTNLQQNHGGSVSSGWEGIAIDEIVFHHQRGTNLAQSTVFKDFNNPPNIFVNSSDGWLSNGSATLNQWQWTNTMGLNAQDSISYNFNNFASLPSGWSISAQDSNQWEYGEIPTNAIYGPDAWHSGDYGFGIALDGKYSNEMLTHLYSPEYNLPENSTSRLTFRSWICTEANWDGGAVSASTDGGINWWYMPANVGAFHDQISTVNSNSPFFNEGILDGSTVGNNCRNSSRPFDLKQYDVSNLSGNDIRFKYSFFSDQLIELDGWYIDDAGIEIDMFQESGTWLSPPIYPDDEIGWGQLDGFVNQPEGTAVKFEIIDNSTGQVIPGYSNRSLPVDINLNPLAINAIKVRVNFSSTNPYLTPSIERLELGINSYIDWYHVKNGVYSTENYSEFYLSEDNRILTNSQSSISIDINPICPFSSATVITNGDNITQSSQIFDQFIQPSPGITMYQQSNIPSFSDNLTLSIDTTGSIQQVAYQPNCVLSSKQIEVNLGDNMDELFTLPNYVSSQSIASSNSFTSVSIDGSTTLPDNNGTYLLDLLKHQTLNLDYQIMALGNNLVESDSQLINLDLTVDSSIQGQLAVPQFADLTYSIGLTNLNLKSFSDCSSKSFDNGMLGINMGVANCTISLTATTNLTITINNFLAISPLDQIITNLSISQLNQAKNQHLDSGNHALLEMPIHVKSEFGKVSTKINYTSYLHQIDRIDNIDKTQWLPNTDLTLQTSHLRFDPITMSEIGYGFDKITLAASVDSGSTNTEFIIEVNDLYSNHQFTIISGSNKVSVNDLKSNVSCLEGYCLINWTITSSWQLDDIDDVNWLISSTDSEGLVTGPTSVRRQTQFNEIENDLEIFELSASDSNSRVISDWTNANWPYRFNSQEILSVHGKVRFQGITDGLVNQGNGEVAIILTAVPPTNLSGGFDEWVGEPVNWSQSWFVEVGEDGKFTVDISTPSNNEVPSNTNLKLHAQLSRLGPSNDISANSLDQTSPNIGTKLIFDTGSPQIKAINIYDPSGLTTADGHIWTLDQDIPIQVNIEDIEGLDTELTVYTWAEYTDDQNGDGLMDEEEYRLTTVSVNYASTSAMLDIPAISWQEVKGPLSSGKLSIVLQISDLAGNALANGGTFGETTDAATILVQDQLQTLLDTSALSLDHFDNQLLPTYEHTFSYSLTDFNGIDSLDSINLALLGRELPDQCNIDYYPRTASTTYDEHCFISPPITQVTKFQGVQKWYVEVKFALSWQAAQTYAKDGGIPSLKAFDEGQDLLLGTSLLRSFSWQSNTVIIANQLAFTDQTLPTGQSDNSTAWVSPSDQISVSGMLLHNGSQQIITHLSNINSVGCIIDGVSIESINTEFSNGFLQCNITVPSSISNSFFDVQLWVLSDDGQFNSTLNGTINVDKARPILNLALGDLLRLDSDKLDQVRFNAEVYETTQLNNAELIVYWNLLRNGQQLNQEPFTSSLNLQSVTDSLYKYDGIVNLNQTGEFNISEDDELVIWLTMPDNSGKPLMGFATIEEPLIPKLTWIDFEPVINLVELRTDNPVNGEALLITTRLVNTGLEQGQVTVQISDINGKVLASNDVVIDGGAYKLIDWEIEAWTVGDIQLIVSLPNYSQAVLLEIEDVDEFQSSQRDLMGTIGLLIIFVVVIVGGFGYAYLQRAKHLEQYTKIHIEQIRGQKRLDREKLAQNHPSSEEE